jgi:hypothetical protein
MTDSRIQRVIVAALPWALAGALFTNAHCSAQQAATQPARRPAPAKQNAAKQTAKKAREPLPTVPPPVRDPEHTFQIKVRNYVQIQRQIIVMQRRDFSCGAACLATIAHYYW